MSAIIFQTQSFLIVALFIFGAIKHKNRNLHVKTMITGIIWDIVLILQIELTRGAIAKASKVVTNRAILNFHVSIAVLCVLLYIVMFITGKKLLNGNNDIRDLHKNLGRTTILLRVLVLITSFWTVQ
jgi:uncharacterized membrane protein YozB (DUF420 family)